MLSPEAIVLLRKVEVVILEEPKRLNMNYTGIVRSSLADETMLWPSCGTVGCIAGWASLLATPNWETMELWDRRRAMSWEDGQAALGLSYAQSWRLFAEPRCAIPNGNCWPDYHAKAYLDAETPEERARITVDRIERFIRTGGDE